MQTPSEKTGKLLLSTEEELFALIIDARHPFRKLKEIINFPLLIDPMRSAYSTLGAHGIDVEKGIKALLIQFWEDYSDREMEKAIRENLAIRWFCGFSLTEATPDYSYFSKLRKRIGTKRISRFFEDINTILEDRGLFAPHLASLSAAKRVTFALFNFSSPSFIALSRSFQRAVLVTMLEASIKVKTFPKSPFLCSSLLMF